MTTQKLYLTGAAAPHTPGGEPFGAWDKTTSASIYKMGSKAGSVSYGSSSETSTTNNYDVLVVGFCSDALSGSGTVNLSANGYCIGGYESSTSANDYLHLHIYVIDASDNLRGTILSDHIGSTEFSNSASTGGRAGSPSGTSVNYQNGDYIIAEVGYRAVNTSSTSYTGRIYYGGTSSTDLSNGASASSYPGWIEFEFGGGTTDAIVAFSAGSASAAGVATGVVTNTSVGATHGSATCAGNTANITGSTSISIDISFTAGSSTADGLGAAVTATRNAVITATHGSVAAEGNTITVSATRNATVSVTGGSLIASTVNVVTSGGALASLSSALAQAGGLSLNLMGNAVLSVTTGDMGCAGNQITVLADSSVSISLTAADVSASGVPLTVTGTRSASVGIAVGDTSASGSNVVVTGTRSASVVAVSGAMTCTGLSVGVSGIRNVVVPMTQALATCEGNTIGVSGESGASDAYVVALVGDASMLGIDTPVRVDGVQTINSGAAELSGQHISASGSANAELRPSQSIWSGYTIIVIARTDSELDMCGIIDDAISCTGVFSSETTMIAIYSTIDDIVATYSTIDDIEGILG